MKEQFASDTERNNFGYSLLSLGCDHSYNNWFAIKQWLWESYKIIFYTNENCGKFSGSLFEGEKEKQHLMDIEVPYSNSPITAEIEGIKKAVEYLYGQIKK